MTGSIYFFYQSLVLLELIFVQGGSAMQIVHVSLEQISIFHYQKVIYRNRRLLLTGPYANKYLLLNREEKEPVGRDIIHSDTTILYENHY